MGKQSRVRSSRQKPLSPRRRRELQVLAERDIMTVAQFKEWEEKRNIEEDDFMSDPRLLQCSCGRNVKTSILDACDRNWFVRTRDLRVLEAKCPACSGPYLLKLSRDVDHHLAKN
jgi:hypothetical protein